MKAIFVVLGLLAAPALGSAGQRQQPHPPHEPGRSSGSGRHHHGAGSQPDAPPPVAPAMPGLSAAQVLSGPLPMFPAQPSAFDASPSTYLPHRGISPFLRPRGAIVIGGYVFGGDAPLETPLAVRPAETPAIDTSFIAPRRPKAQPPDAQPPAAPSDAPAFVAPPPIAGPVTLYVIPGCYAGDKPPADGMLPAGCDLTKMRTVIVR